jgi:hypothetical protein
MELGIVAASSADYDPANGCVAARRITMSRRTVSHGSRRPQRAGPESGSPASRRSFASAAILLSALVLGLIAAVALNRTLSRDGTPPSNLALIGVLWLLIGLAIVLAWSLVRRLSGEDS